MISKVTPEKIRNPESDNLSFINQEIPFLGGRPTRDIIISADDIMNLIIACNTCNTLEDFFRNT